MGSPLAVCVWEKGGSTKSGREKVFWATLEKTNLVKKHENGSGIRSTARFPFGIRRKTKSRRLFAKKRRSLKKAGRKPEVS